MRAANHGHRWIVDILLTAGAKVDVRNRDGDTALLLAALKIYTGAMSVLLAHGADVDARDNSNNTPLMRLAMMNFNKRLFGEGMTNSLQEKLLSMLVTAGADVNAENDNGETALTWAVKHGNHTIESALIAAGAGWRMNKTLSHKTHFSVNWMNKILSKSLGGSLSFKKGGFPEEVLSRSHHKIG